MAPAVGVEEVAPDETMESKIEAEIEKCQQECSTAVEEYYATKVNPHALSGRDSTTASACYRASPGHPLLH